MTSGLAGGGVLPGAWAPLLPHFQEQDLAAAPLHASCSVHRRGSPAPGGTLPWYTWLHLCRPPPQHPWGGPLSPVHRKLKYRAWWVQSRESNLRVSPHG